MNFSDGIKAHAKRVADNKDYVTSEEGTKMALIVPFMRFLGYEPNDPRVVIPEYCADFGEKKGSKVDYAIKRGENIVMIVEAKKVGESLDGAKEAQLQQYFQSIVSVKIAILTDGVIYKFYTDLEAPNIMDKRPFMTFDFSVIDETLIPELQKLCNECFDLETALSAAQDLKYLGQIKTALTQNFENPEEDFVRYFMRKADMRATPKAIGQFIVYTKRAFDELIAEQVDNRLKTALSSTAKKEEEHREVAPAAAKEPEITENEWQALYLVKSIVMGTVSADRVQLRSLSGVGRSMIIMDNSGLKPLVYLRFQNPEKLSVEVVGPNKEKALYAIDKIEDLLAHAETIRSAVRAYFEKGKPGQ